MFERFSIFFLLFVNNKYIAKTIFVRLFYKNFCKKEVGLNQTLFSKNLVKSPLYYYFLQINKQVVKTEKCSNNYAVCSVAQF
ncbi:hypothetical protein CV682_06490 [Borreliella burgdorferi]|nr:hypothetical protein CV682_06490 [Borreliella burgdorferi]